MNPSLMTDPFRVFGIFAGQAGTRWGDTVPRCSVRLRQLLVYRYPSFGVPQQDISRMREQAGADRRRGARPWWAQV